MSAYLSSNDESKEIEINGEVIAVIVQFFKAGKLFFSCDDVIMASRLVVQISKVGVLQF